MEHTRKKGTDDIEFLDEVNYSYRKHQNKLKDDTTWTVDNDTPYDLTMTWGNEEVTDQEFERIRKGAAQREKNRNIKDESV